MQIRFGYEIAISCAAPTPLICLLSVHPDRRGDLIRDDAMVTAPALPTTTYIDQFGNLCRRLVAPPGRTVLSADGLIGDSGAADPLFADAREVAVADLPDDVLVFLLPSRYCETEALSNFAWSSFGHLAPGWSRVQAIMDYANGRIAFGYGQARATRTAAEAWNEGVGVCRDFAHLAITLCRAMNIPARYVNGYLGDIGVPVTGPMDYAAWMEVWLDGPQGGQWVTFDPRNNARRIGRIVVARGRDAADVPLIHSFGQHNLDSFRVIADEVAAAGGAFAA